MLDIEKRYAELFPEDGDYATEHSREHANTVIWVYRRLMGYSNQRAMALALAELLADWLSLYVVVNEARTGIDALTTQRVRRAALTRLVKLAMERAHEHDKDGVAEE